jgi:anti-sigma factor RsiW
VELQTDYENLCEQYLLGDLSESDCQQLEEAYFADDSLFERFLAVKDDLLDAYTRGDLTGQKLERFEQHFLSSEARQQRVEEARELIQAVSSASVNTAISETTVAEPPGKPTLALGQWFSKHLSLHPVVLRLGFAALLLVVFVGGWIVVRQLQDRAARRSAEAAQAKPPGAAQETRSPEPSPSQNIVKESNSSPAPTPRPEIAAKPSTQPSSVQVASLTLLPFSSRDTGSANSLTLSQEVRLVRLNLVFSGASYDGFEASVRTVDGQQVFRRGGLKANSNASGKSVTLTVDSSLLRRQDYLVSLSGRSRNGKLETLGEYYFRIERSSPKSKPSPTD